jgi:p-cumate 2,3-dioxygenase alpha subunit
MDQINKSGDEHGIRVDLERNTFEVSRRVFTDPEVLRIEHERIFKKCWLYIGHDSEVAKPGAFLTRDVGGRGLIFNRDAKGKVNAFYNLCTHRGGRVCREKSGVARSFQCFYHGWIFDADGSLKNIPQEDLYPEGFRQSGQHGLVHVPRLEQYRGFWFICFDANAMSLTDYLAGAKPYLDDIADQSEVGMQILPGAQSFSVAANWKLWHENGIDPFHVATVHATYFDFASDLMEEARKKAIASGQKSDLFEKKIDAEEMMRGRYELLKKLQNQSLDLGNGHLAYNYPSSHGRPFALWHPLWGQDVKEKIDATYARLVERVGPERAQRMAHFNHHILIFPNLAIVDNHGIMIRTYFSKTPEAMVVNSWTIAPAEESLEVRRARLFSYMDFLGPGGFGTPDDIEAIEQAQQGYLAAEDFGGWNNVSAGMAPKNAAGRAIHGDEGRIRVFWKTWDQYIGAALANY